MKISSLCVQTVGGRFAIAGKFALLRSRMLPLLVAMGLAMTAPGITAQDASDPEAQGEVSGRFGPGASGAFVARNGMVSTSSHWATMAGLEALRAGGNAFDAMAVVQCVLTVTEPYASGIGGGLLSVFYDAETRTIVNLDAREEAPRAFSTNAFLDREGKPLPFRERFQGGLSVGVPGTLAAVAHLLAEHGTWTLADALQPAIRIAREGFIVTEPFERNLEHHWKRLQKYPATVKLFSREDGSPLRAGDLLRNPDLAATFEQIAKEGIAVFYEGEIAREIVATIREDALRPGVMTLEDLKNYRAVRRKPVASHYRGYEIYGANMPGSGATSLGLMLNILEATGFAAQSASDSIESYLLLIDAQNLAFADRNRYMADADFVDVPVAGLLDPGYAEKRAALIKAGRILPIPVEPGIPPGALPFDAAGEEDKPPSTTHYSIVDRHGNVVSTTSTIEQHFGCGMVVPGRGFILNNQLTDFDAKPYDKEGRLVPNAPQGGWKPRRTALGADAKTEGGKRPRSSMTPTLVLKDGKPRLALGSPGGSRIIGSTLNVLVNILDRNMSLQAAVDAPRLIARNGPVEIEGPLFREGTLRSKLEAEGAKVLELGSTGSVQAILIGEDGWLRGAADPRRAGLALGY